MKTRNEIREYLENLNDGELLSLWNEYRRGQYYDGEVYYMEEFNEICESLKPIDLATKMFYGKFNPNNEYFIFNGYANLESSNYLDDFIDIDELAQHIYDNDDSLDDYDLRNFLDEDEDSEE